tara:strand:- start:1295 stop:2218 length:924 start_codon:yes stop_codon:yes gene_type:complete
MKIDIIIPVYNSESCLDELLKQLQSSLEIFSYHIYFVNDNSQDNSWEKLEEISHLNKNIVLINLAKNFGQDCAIMAGLNQSDGDYVVIMDDDLQHSPSDIIPLIEKLKDEKSDVCYGKYNRKNQSIIKNLGSWLNDKLANIVIKKPKHIYLSPFKVLRKSIVKKIIQYDGPYPYIDGLIFRFTSRITEIDINHHKRFDGKGNYNLYKSTSLWIRVLTNFSVVPLRISTYVGIIASISGFMLGLYFIIKHLFGMSSPEGWPSLIVTILVIGGIQLLGMGIIGEYVGRSFIYQSKEPQFLIDEIIRHDE